MAVRAVATIRATLVVVALDLDDTWNKEIRETMKRMMGKEEIRTRTVLTVLSTSSMKRALWRLELVAFGRHGRGSECDHPNSFHS